MVIVRMDRISGGQNLTPGVIGWPLKSTSENAPEISLHFLQILSSCKGCFFGQSLRIIEAWIFPIYPLLVSPLGKPLFSARAYGPRHSVQLLMWMETQVQVSSHSLPLHSFVLCRGLKVFLESKVCVICLEICPPSLSSPYPLWSRNYKTCTESLTQ